MKDIIFIDKFIDNSLELYEDLQKNIIWDERMIARKTASFGVAYNYSEMSYPYQKMTPNIENLSKKLENTLHFLPNNCLINYYPDGQSKMGFHSDQTDILFENTGIAIISLGETRILKFRNIENKEMIMEYELTTGSLIYMTQAIQHIWQHAIPKKNTTNGRMSLTYRKIKNEFMD